MQCSATSSRVYICSSDSLKAIRTTPIDFEPSTVCSCIFSSFPVGVYYHGYACVSACGTAFGRKGGVPPALDTANLCRAAITLEASQIKAAPTPTMLKLFQELSRLVADSLIVPEAPFPSSDSSPFNFFFLWHESSQSTRQAGPTSRAQNEAGRPEKGRTKEHGLMHT